MITRTQIQRCQTPVTILLSAAALVAIVALTGCSGAGQSEVTQSDRPSEGEGWAVQEQMAGGN